MKRAMDRPERSYYRRRVHDSPDDVLINSLRGHVVALEMIVSDLKSDDSERNRGAAKDLAKQLDRLGMTLAEVNKRLEKKGIVK